MTILNAVNFFYDNCDDETINTNKWTVVGTGITENAQSIKGSKSGTADNSITSNDLLQFGTKFQLTFAGVASCGVSSSTGAVSLKLNSTNLFTGTAPGTAGGRIASVGGTVVITFTAPNTINVKVQDSLIFSGGAAGTAIANDTDIVGTEVVIKCACTNSGASGGVDEFVLSKIEILR